ncbi:hypothetical protein AYR66_14270 [Noviherbaspirillum denitrificans]|uniref:DUF4384 domain-containing protein n=1 Tax=Noviherbaspirillum denitrificans TaxID=1968433 RepID=A0A254TCV2_9BURK|nr:hypothetical protein AYR66_14270 [Noviherbaspirillum denitrificans]
MLATLAFNYYKGSKEQVTETPEVVKEETREPPALATTPPTPVVPPLTMEAVTPVLSRIPCSILLPTIKDNTLQVRGYLAESGTTRAKEMLNAIPGVQALNLDVRQVADEKCGAVELFGPYWAQNQAAGTPVSVKTKPVRNVLVEGDSVVLDVTTPPWDSHVYVDYFSFDGSVLHMVPSPRARANQAPANYSATIGSMGNWTVAKPFGTDLIVMVATPMPMFDGMRPEAEAAGDYLKAADKQLKQIASKHGREKILVDFLQVTTKAKK